MPVFENAIAVITGKPFKLNDKLDYKCLDGYENRDGNTTGSMVCDKDGWTHLPTCYSKCFHSGISFVMNQRAHVLVVLI